MHVARFEITLSTPQSEPVEVTYKTTGGTALADVDYGSKEGRVTFQPGELRKTVGIAIRDPNPASFPTGRTVEVTLFEPEGPPGIQLGSSYKYVLTVSTDEILPVPFPGRRLGLVGDSITWYNSAWTAPQASGYFQAYGAAAGGYWTHADQILGGRLSLEPRLENNMQGHHNGNNFGIASTRVMNWWKPEDIPVEGSGVVEVGPMYAALANANAYDVVVLLGGTNDLSFNQRDVDIFANLKTAITDLTRLGKWVFAMTIWPRTRDLLKGYTLAQQDTIRERLENVNQMLRDWVANDTPANVFLVDPWDVLVGPNGIDPAGFQSSTTDPEAPSTKGNYKVGEEGVIYFHDGLHPAPAGAYQVGKVLAQAMIDAGIPARTSTNIVGKYNLGPNLLPNPQMTFTQYPIALDPPNYELSYIGWATGLGNHLTLPNGNHNGYQYGRVPDHWKFWRSNNKNNERPGIAQADGGTYSNFMEYTFGSFVWQFPEMLPYMNDSDWPDGSVQTSIVTHNGGPAFRIDFNIPQTTAPNKGQSFVFESSYPKGQHGIWDNYGFQSPDMGVSVPNTLYQPGDFLMGEVDLTFIGIDKNIVTCHAVNHMYSFPAFGNNSSWISSLGNQMNFWPPSDIDNLRETSEARTVKLHLPTIQAPPKGASDTAVFGTFKIEVCVDASQGPVTGSIIVKDPRICKVLNPGV